jgi:hypothetical protein
MVEVISNLGGPPPPVFGWHIDRGLRRRIVVGDGGLAVMAQLREG